MLYFLSGLPRSGSTVLSSLLNQHPDVYSTATSGLIDLMGALCNAWQNVPTVHTQKSDKEEVYRMLRSLLESKYSTIGKKNIVDKNRGWVMPPIMDTMQNVLGQPVKIIATVRNVPDCASSFVRLVNPENMQKFIYESQLLKHLKSSYAMLNQGFSQCPKNFCFIDYDDLIANPKKEMKKIHDFLELASFKYDFNNIDTNIVAERDEEVWGISGLHKISPKLKRQSIQNSREVLGHYYDQFDPPRFWKGETFENVKPKKIDISVKLSMNGDFKKSYDVLKEAQRENPHCNKIAFNMGWFALRNNKLQEGMQYLSRGRYENCFGNGKPMTDRPIWDGKSKGVVLYNLEGGLGDQIHSLKYIKDINERGCEVVVACSQSLFPIVKSAIGVKTIVGSQAASFVYHDFWVPAMSVIIPLGYEYDDISGKPVIPRTHFPENKKPVIGLRWQGNPEFEHEQNRRFPLAPFFNAFKNIDAHFICLQRDEGEEDCPNWVRKVPLNNWEETRHAVSSCDLVVSSCTSVAHLAGCIGVPTWVIIPVLNYYIWAVPGNKTPYYDSVTLFRQKKFGCWDAPLAELKKEINKKYGKVKASRKHEVLCKNKR